MRQDSFLSHRYALFRRWLCGKADSGLERILCWLKELHESMDRCTGRRDLTEILLKTALNSIQSINQPIFIGVVKSWDCVAKGYYDLCYCS